MLTPKRLLTRISAGAHESPAADPSGMRIFGTIAWARDIMGRGCPGLSQWEAAAFDEGAFDWTNQLRMPATSLRCVTVRAIGDDP
jgi:hypothetical protein